MTIQEAIKSGRPFRRKAWATSGKMDDDWVYDSAKEDHGLVYITSEVEAVFHREDFLADDWEVKPAEPVVFKDAWVRGCDDYAVLEITSTLLNPLVEQRVKVTVELAEGESE